MSTLTTTSPSQKVKTSRESILYGHDFTKLLVAGETLTGTPSLSVQPSGVTFSGPIVNVATFVNDAGETVAIGAGVQIRISGGTSGTSYSYTVQCGTSAGNTRELPCVLQVSDT